MRSGSVTRNPHSTSLLLLFAFLFSQAALAGGSSKTDSPPSTVWNGPYGSLALVTARVKLYCDALSVVSKDLGIPMDAGWLQSALARDISTLSMLASKQKLKALHRARHWLRDCAGTQYLAGIDEIINRGPGDKAFCIVYQLGHIPVSKGDFVNNLAGTSIELPDGIIRTNTDYKELSPTHHNAIYPK